MTVAPCKQPKVTVDPRPGGDTYDVNCHVPGCGFTYPTDKRFCALRSDAADHARIHRQAHRTGVPTVSVERSGAGFTAICQGCDLRDPKNGVYRAGRGEADEWVRHHLFSVHGVVK